MVTINFIRDREVGMFARAKRLSNLKFVQGKAPGVTVDVDKISDATVDEISDSDKSE
jgi:hypothetical protein